jgi:hypothetical protein
MYIDTNIKVILYIRARRYSMTPKQTEKPPPLPAKKVISWICRKKLKYHRKPVDMTQLWWNNMQWQDSKEEKGKRSERSGRKASGLKLLTTMTAELLFEIISALPQGRLEPFLLPGSGFFFLPLKYSRGC